jgi:hypothetical protein
MKCISWIRPERHRVTVMMIYMSLGISCDHDSDLIHDRAGDGVGYRIWYNDEL